MLATAEIELQVAKAFNPRSHTIVPNVSWGMGIEYEMDLCVLTPSWYGHEIEIKRSRSDLRADMKKQHFHDSELVRYLWYAIPEEMLKDIDLIPEHAGIMVARPGQTVVGIKRRPKTNFDSRRWTQYEVLKLMRLGCMRIWPLKAKLVVDKR